MEGVNNNITLGVGNISTEKDLGCYYQDISPAIVHITSGSFAKLDEDGIPYIELQNKREYYIVTVIQYGLMCFDLYCKDIDIQFNINSFWNCIHWLDKNKISYKDCFVWRSNDNEQYGLKKGWISGMYQGQAISVYLRAYQHSGNEQYLNDAKSIFKSFDLSYEEGGFKRIDENGYLWYEEYPTKQPSFVLNGFIYSILGLHDLYRVTKDKHAKELWDSCIKTLVNNLQKYDVWYWSIYDQLKEELVSYYYQKNVHVPLMEILYGLTKDEIFNRYATKWKKNLTNPLHGLITRIMYRVQPRIKKLKRK